MAIKIIPIPPTLLSTETVLYEIKITYSVTEEGSLFHTKDVPSIKTIFIKFQSDILSELRNFAEDHKN